MTVWKVRGIIRWPDGTQETTGWVPDRDSDPTLAGLLDAMVEVLERHGGGDGAEITTERQELEVDESGKPHDPMKVQN